MLQNSSTQNKQVPIPQNTNGALVQDVVKLLKQNNQVQELLSQLN